MLNEKNNFFESVESKKSVKFLVQAMPPKEPNDELIATQGTMPRSMMPVFK